MRWEWQRLYSYGEGRPLGKRGPHNQPAEPVEGERGRCEANGVTLYHSLGSVGDVTEELSVLC